jgi:hypothetical protein
MRPHQDPLINREFSKLSNEVKCNWELVPWFKAGNDWAWPPVPIEFSAKQKNADFADGL